MDLSIEHSLEAAQERYRQQEVWRERHVQWMRGARGAPRKWKGVHGGVPTFLRAQCATSSQGGQNSYEQFGFTLGMHLRNVTPGDIEDDEWFAQMGQMEALLIADSSERALLWLEFHLPKIFALVPARRRHQLLAGLDRARDEGGFVP